MPVIPRTLRTISIKKKPKRYYSGYIDNKYHVYTFSNEQAVSECAFFISQYKSRYGEFPEINQNRDIAIKNNLINPLYQKSIFYIMENELDIEEENTDKIVEMCSNANIGLLVIYDFNFTLSPSKIDLAFSASSIIPENNNKIFYLDKLLLNEGD